MNAVYNAVDSAKAHVREAPVGALGPWISWSLGVEVNPAVAQLADPAHQIAISIGISSAEKQSQTTRKFERTG